MKRNVFFVEITKMSEFFIILIDRPSGAYGSEGFLIERNNCVIDRQTFLFQTFLFVL